MPKHKKHKKEEMEEEDSDEESSEENPEVGLEETEEDPDYYQNCP